MAKLVCTAGQGCWPRLLKAGTPALSCASCSAFASASFLATASTKSSCLSVSWLGTLPGCAAKSALALLRPLSSATFLVSLSTASSCDLVENLAGPPASATAVPPEILAISASTDAICFSFSSAIFAMSSATFLASASAILRLFSAWSSTKDLASYASLASAIFLACASTASRRLTAISFCSTSTAARRLSVSAAICLVFFLAFASSSKIFCLL